MSCTKNIALPESRCADLALHVEPGDGGNTSDAARDLIRKNQHEQGLNRLRALVADGLASGPATPDTLNDWDALQAIAQAKTA